MKQFMLFLATLVTLSFATVEPVYERLGLIKERDTTVEMTISPTGAGKNMSVCFWVEPRDTNHITIFEVSGRGTATLELEETNGDLQLIFGHNGTTQYEDGYVLTQYEKVFVYADLSMVGVSCCEVYDSAAYTSVFDPECTGWTLLGTHTSYGLSIFPDDGNSGHRTAIRDLKVWDRYLENSEVREQVDPPVSVTQPLTVKWTPVRDVTNMSVLLNGRVMHTVNTRHRKLPTLRVIKF